MMIFVTGSFGSLILPICRAPKGQALDAGGLHALGDPVVAEVAFLGVCTRVEEPHAVGAAHDAVAAADAPRPVHEDYAVRGLIGGADRADLHAGRIFALVAELGHEKRLIDVLFSDVLELALVRGRSWS